MERAEYSRLVSQKTVVVPFLSKETIRNLMEIRSMGATLTWLDLSKHGLALALGAVKDDPQFVIVGGKEAIGGSREAIESLGFVSRGTHYYLPDSGNLPSLEKWKEHFPQGFMNPETLPGRVAKDYASAVFMVENGWVDKEAMFPSPKLDPEAVAKEQQQPTETSSAPSDEPQAADNHLRWLSLAPYGLSVQYRKVDSSTGALSKEGERQLVVLGGRRTEGLFAKKFEQMGAVVDLDVAHGEFARIRFPVSKDGIAATLEKMQETFPFSELASLPKDLVGGESPEANEIFEFDVNSIVDWQAYQDALEKAVKSHVDADIVPPFSDEFLRDLLFESTKLPEEVLSAKGGVNPRQLQESLEAATVQVFRDISLSSPNELSVALGRKLDAVMPKDNIKTATSQQLQQFSTPLAISYVAQDVLGIQPNHRVFDATIGNGSLVSMVKPENVYGIELDRQRLKGLQAAGYSNVEYGDSIRKAPEDQLYERIVFNPPFGTFADGGGPRDITSFVPFEGLPQYPTMKVKSQDQYIALRHLQSLKKDGLGFMVLGADHPMRFAEGEYSDSTRSFLQFLADTHDVVSMHYVSGKLYSTHGAAWPLLMVITAGRRDHVVEASIPDKLPVISSWEDLEGYRVEMKEELLKWSREQDEEELTDPGEGGRGGNKPTETGPEQGDDSEPEVTETPLAEDEQQEEPAEEPIQEENDVDADELAGEQDAEGVDYYDDEELDAEPETVHASAEDAEVPYMPRSGMFSLEKMIPANLAYSVQRALNKVELHHGNIDSFVAEELGWSLEELGDGRLAAEQVDAIALAMHQGELDRGFILGDNTGIGKGRVMAAMVVWGIKKGKKPVFMTSKAGLFGDILRDFRDIGEEHLINPLVINDIPKIKDDKGNVVLKNTPADELAPLIEANTIGENHNCVFMTYSQINRELSKCRKAQWLTFVAEDNYLLLDEIHNGAGNDSNTGENLIEAIRAAEFTLGSSGTYAKRPDNLGLYIFTSMFDGTDAQTLMDTVSAGGTEYQELLSTMLAESGQMIVRSHPEAPSPTPKLVNTVYNGKTAREITDQMSVILDGLTGMSGGVQEIIQDDNKEIKAMLDRMPDGPSKKAAKRWGSSALNFGSIMHHVVRQAALAMKVQGAVDSIKGAIQEGKRVVVGLDQTMETFLKYAEKGVKAELIEASVSRKELEGEGGEGGEGQDGEEALVSAENDRTLTQFANGVPANIGYRDTILRLMKRLITIEDTDRYGNVSERLAFDIEEKREDLESGALMERMALGQTQDGDELASVFFSLEEKVLELPEDLPASPIDAMRQELLDAGIISTEITGRSLQIDYSDRENPVFKHRSSEDKDRRRAEQEFNHGESQVVFVNSSGAEGVSLHGHKDFKNNEDRRMIFVQIPYDIATYNQLAGRIDRSGAREGYKAETELLGLDIVAEKRLMAALVRKDSSLKANTRGDQEGKVQMYGVPMLNRVGDLVTCEVLEAHPDIEYLEKRLGINIESEGDKFSGIGRKTGAGSETGLYSKVLSRLSRVKLAEAEPLVEMFENAYLQRIEELDKAGVNPLKTQILDIRAKFSPDVYEIVPQSGPSAFQASVDARVIQYEQTVRPVELSSVKAIMKGANERLGSLSMSDYPLQDKWDEISAKQNTEIERHGKKRCGELYQSLVTKDRAIAPDAFREMILKSPGMLQVEDPVKDILKKIATRHKLFQAMRDKIGLGVTLTGVSLDDMGFDGGDEPGTFVIVNIKPPKPVDNPASASNWDITLAAPDGVNGVLRMSLSQLMTVVEEVPTHKFSVDPITESRLSELFNEEREGYTVERERIVLMGNLFGAAEAAKNASKEYGDVGVANPIVFTDESGAKHRAMLMGNWFEVADINKLKTVDFTISKPDIAKAYVDHILGSDREEKELCSTNAYYSLMGARSANKAPKIGEGIRILRDTETNQWMLQIGYRKKDNGKYLADSVLNDMIDGEFTRCNNHLYRNLMEAPLKSNSLLPDVIDRLMLKHRTNFQGLSEDADWYRNFLRERGVELKKEEEAKEMLLSVNEVEVDPSESPEIEQELAGYESEQRRVALPGMSY